MNRLLPIKNIFRNKKVYIILFILLFLLISSFTAALNMFITTVLYSYRAIDKYGSIANMAITPVGSDIKSAMSKIKDDKFIKEIYYPGIETNSHTLNDKLQVEYIHNNEIKKDKPEIKQSISYIGLETDLIKYSGDEFDFIEGRMYENNNECVINKTKDSNTVWSSLKVGDKIVMHGTGENIELTISGIIKNEIKYEYLLNENLKKELEYENLLLYTSVENIFELATRYKSQSGGEVIENIIEENKVVGTKYKNNNVDYNVIEPNNPLSVNNVFNIEGRQYGYKCVIVLNDPNLFVDFQQYAMKITKGSQELCPVNFYYDEEFTRDGGLRDINRPSAILMLIILVMIIVTIIIVINMNLQNRRREFATLRSMGMSKFKITGSCIVETLIFTLFTSFISVVAGGLIFIYGLWDITKSIYESIVYISLPIVNLLIANAVAYAITILIVILTTLISINNILDSMPLKMYRDIF